jgi:hypothetical protein
VVSRLLIGHMQSSDMEAHSQMLTRKRDPMLSSTNAGAQTSLADAFFFVELRSCLGSDKAHEWHRTTISPSVSEASIPSAGLLSYALSTTPPPAMHCGESLPPPKTMKRSKSDPILRQSKSDLFQEHGCNMGLLFTDAAHQLLDSPTSSTRGRDD